MNATSSSTWRIAGAVVAGGVVGAGDGEQVAAGEQVGGDDARSRGRSVGHRVTATSSAPLVANVSESRQVAAGAVGEACGVRDGGACRADQGGEPAAGRLAARRWLGPATTRGPGPRRGHRALLGCARSTSLSATTSKPPGQRLPTSGAAHSTSGARPALAARDPRAGGPQPRGQQPGVPERHRTTLAASSLPHVRPTAGRCSATAPGAERAAVPQSRCARPRDLV